jgi:hypothetical protein
MIFTLLMLILLTPLFAVSEEVANIFGDGVFDTKWGMTLEQVEEVFPNGKKITNLGNTIALEVNDDRAVLDIVRSKKDKITFGFDDVGRLASVSVSFRDDDEEIITKLISKLNTLFGKYKIDITEPNPLIDPLMSVAVSKFEWPEDNGININIIWSQVGFSGSLELSIFNTSLKKPEVSKESLGF